MISSTSNAQVRQVNALAKKAKARRESGLFLVEGEKMFSELPKERLYRAYVSENFLRQHGERAERLLAGCRFETVTDEVMRAMSDTQTPQGILALCRQFSYELSDIIGSGGENGGGEHAEDGKEKGVGEDCGGKHAENGKGKDGGENGGETSRKDAGKSRPPAQLVILETLQDPGNLGTILRAGEGAGITGVIMDRTTADIYNPKVIRSTMGSIYRVPFVYVDDLKGALKAAKGAGVRLYAAHLEGRRSYDEEDYRQSAGFLIGNEANGLSRETADMADCYVRIPMLGKVESLNAAVAASILMFEAARQRRQQERKAGR